VTKKPPDQQVEFLRALLEYNVKAIAEREDDVRIQTDETPGRVVFTVFVHHDDMGLVLGNAGKTADSIRQILWSACKKTVLKIDMDIITNGRAR
jgi:predicted RNA-binding protein YlqC (UPF0109 family)